MFYFFLSYWLLCGVWFWIIGKDSTLAKYNPITDFLFSFGVGGVMFPVQLMIKITR